MFRLGLATALVPPIASAQGAPATGSHDSTWAEHAAAATAARKRGDMAGYRDQLLELDRLWGGRPQIVYSLAYADARMGNRSEALRWLGTFASMGLTLDVGADSVLRPLMTEPGYSAIATQFSRNAVPVHQSHVLRVLPDSAMIAECLAYDRASKRFFVTSVRGGNVVVVDDAGATSDFALPAGHGYASAFAVSIDSRRGVLWVTTAELKTARGYADANAGRTSLLKYDIRTHALVSRYELPHDGQPHLLGDMGIDSTGSVFVTDSRAGGVFRLTPGDTALRVLIPPGEFPSPQTPAPTPDGKFVYVPDYVRGIARVDTRDGSIVWLKPPRTLATAGIDGLYLDGSTLIAVQNGTAPSRLLRMQMDRAGDALTSWETLESSGPDFDEFTHATLDGRTLYFLANVGWNQVGEDETVNRGAVFKHPVILALPLRRP